MYGTKIVIESPQAGSSVHAFEEIEITGYVKHVDLLELNGRKILTDGNGFFKEELIPAIGYNVFELRAKDRFGREEVSIFELTGV